MALRIWICCITHDVILKDTPPPLVADITFEESAVVSEISFSDRIATEHQDLVDQSAVWLENEMSVMNLGQIDHKILMADGRLSEVIRNSLVSWWGERVVNLDLG
jgi:hypothetical protein